MTCHAYSFCDCMEELARNTYTLPETAEYIYIGSYFCDRYFVNTPKDIWRVCMDKAGRSGCKIVLVVPLPGQQLLKKVCSLLPELMDNNQISELVVNDPGMLLRCGKQFPEIPLWSGRLMSKEIRDPRYDMGVQNPDRYELASDGTLYGIRIKGVEADPVFPMKYQKSDRCRLAVHTPYAFISASRYCELGSLSQQLDRKFRLDTGCGRECISCGLTYRYRDVTFYKAGRAVLTDVQNGALDNLDDVRIIHTCGFDWSSDEITDSRQRN